MTRASKVTTAGLLLGVGLGGFLDGIVLHQIVQWHQMLSSVLPPESMEAMKRNMAADGWFHAAVWLATFAGLLVLWSAVRGPGALPPQHMPAYDWIFLLVGGVGLIFAGLALRAGRRKAPAYGAERRSGHERRLSYR